ncbi:MAG: class I SAM-dependent methyltransferase [Bacteroidota bacterium]
MINIKQQFYDETYKNEGKYTKLRSSYRWLYLLFKKFEVHRLETVIQYISSGQRFLDIGCGSGSLIFKVSDRFNKLYGLDVSRSRLRSIKLKYSQFPEDIRKKVSFKYGDADLKLRFPNNYFDTVTIVAVLEHLYDPIKVMDEIYRVLKVRGKVIVQIPNLGFLPRRLAVLLGNLPVTSEDEKGWDGGHLHYFTVSSIYQYFNRNGLSIKEITCSGIFASLRRKWVSLLGADIIFIAEKNK